MRAIAAITFGVFLALGSPVWAQPPPADGLSFFEGTWHEVDDGCRLQVRRAVSDSMWVFSWSAGSLADLRHVHSCGDAKGWTGFDPEVGAWVDYGLATDGASWRATSKGWVGEAWIWQGATYDCVGKKLVARKTFERRGSERFSVRVEVSEDGQTWRDLGRMAFARGDAADGAV